MGLWWFLQFWKACRFCNKSSLTLVTCANITLVRVINKISVSISCAHANSFIRKVKIFRIWYLRSVFPLNTVDLPSGDFGGRSLRFPFPFRVAFYLSILTKPRLIGDRGVWSLGMLYHSLLSCCTFQYQQFDFLLPRFNAIFTWFNTSFCVI